jgi:hypothetical protein
MKYTLYIFLILLQFVSLLRTPCIYIGTGGNTGAYMVGVMGYIKKHFNIEKYKYTGSSAGSWITIMSKYEKNLTDFDTIWKDFINKDIKFKASLCKYKYIPYIIKGNILTKYGNMKIKKDIGIYVSKIDDKKNMKKVLSYDYNNLEELLELCHCSSYIPIISGKEMSIKYKNNNYIDAIFTLKNEKEDIITNKKNTLIITKHIWNRSFTIKDYIYCDYNNYKKLYEYGWNDTKQNHNKIVEMFPFMTKK